MKEIFLFLMLLVSFSACKNEQQNQIGKWNVTETYSQYDQDSLFLTQQSNFSIKIKNNGFGYWQPKDDKIKFSWEIDTDTILLEKTEDDLNLPYVMEYGSYEMLTDEADFQVWEKEGSIVTNIVALDTFILMTTRTVWELTRQ